MLPEEEARIKIDKQLRDAGWEVVSRIEYNRKNPSAVVEASMKGRKESDYLLFIDNKAIAVVEAKRAENNLESDVEEQAENYTITPQDWYGFWLTENKIPLVYLANGNKILFKNMLKSDSKYVEITKIHTPKEMLQLVGKTSTYGALPLIEKFGLRECQYRAEVNLEKSFKSGKKKALAVLATGSGKTYLACLASYRFLNYTPVKRILFLVDRNNLARQTKSEFDRFDRTETKQTLGELYLVNRLKKPEDIQGDVVISTIQKLYAVLTGKTVIEDDEDKEDEFSLEYDEKHSKEVAKLGDDLKLPPDYFQLIIVDECHRSIYGRWQSVLNYFSGAKVLGLTATPTEEAVAYFDNNIIEKYSYDDSVVDGVNVPQRIYRIATNTSVHGGTIEEGEKYSEKSKRSGNITEYTSTRQIDYSSNELDRSVIDMNQIHTVLTEYRDVIYTKLYPERKNDSELEDWAHIPKTLIFAKDDHHATAIVESIKKVFGEKFPSQQVPKNFVKKITYSSGNSNDLIRDFRVEQDFRIAVTVTLVATGTDIRPLEVVLFMNDVKSEVLYTQMKGRACRTINDDKLKEVTPNAQTKSFYYIVDAVGVTESEKHFTKSGGSGNSTTPLSLERLIEHIVHGEVSDENLEQLRDYCASIHRRYESNPLFIHRLDTFTSEFGFAPRTLANDINKALEIGLPPFENASQENKERMDLVACLIDNNEARKQLLELQKGFYAEVFGHKDWVIESGFTHETALSFTEAFEKYLNENKDRIEALRIIYNSEDKLITYSMLCDLRDKLIAENHQYTPSMIWSNYKLLDTDNRVENFDTKHNVKALTHLIQIVRYAYKKSSTLISLYTGFNQRFNLYCGQIQRTLTDEQKDIMRQIAEYIVNDGAIGLIELNTYDAELWKKGVNSFGPPTLKQEIQTLSKFILKVA